MWICKHCGQNNGNNFTVCSKCGSERMLADQNAEKTNSTAQAHKSKKSSSITLLILALLAIIVAGTTWTINRGKITRLTSDITAELPSDIQVETTMNPYSSKSITDIKADRIFTPVGTQEKNFGHTYKIATVLNNQYVLGVAGKKGEGKNVQLCLDEESEEQLYEIVPFDDNSFYILSATTELAVSPESNDAGCEVNVCLRKNNGADYQAWKLMPATGDSFYIINKASGMFLDVDNAYAADSTNIKLFVRNDGYDAQKWCLYELSESSYCDNSESKNNTDHLMAHNIYSDPDLSETSGKFSAFSIDFMSNKAPMGTYWALCNWEMDLSCLAGFEVTDPGGAYAGLQNRADSKVSIMSFWEVKYLEKDGHEVAIKAQRIIPEGKTNSFSGEGEGTNFIAPFPWKANQWYRMIIRAYDDEKTSNTVVEQWLIDLETEEKFLLCSFDTGLCHSFMKGSMSQFMENYDAATRDEARDFCYRNIFVQDYKTSEWIPISTTTLSVDTWWNDKSGSFSFGSSADGVWGEASGLGEDMAKTENVKTRDVFHIYNSGIYTNVF